MEQLEFSGWVEFSNLGETGGELLEFPGTYLIAHFKRKPAGAVNYVSKNIVYIGETTKQTLKVRLRQFYKSALSGKKGHSGGQTYFRNFTSSKPQKSSTRRFFVTILPVNRPDPECTIYTKYLERLMIWQFFLQNKKYPICNTD